MVPGATALTRMLCSAHSCPRVLVRFSTPARAAPVWAIPGNPRITLAVMLMMVPFFCGIKKVLAMCWHI